MIVKTAAEAKQDRTYIKALTELLYQLADDDFIVAYRGSEWLGLAPHIEEDVAFSSITQNTMGHAFMYYQLLEELGEGEADKLAHERQAKERRNAIYLEKKNGTGTYLENPQFDWALTVVRHYFYEVFKKVKLEAVSTGSYEPLKLVAQKILMEQTYHLAHWELWITQLIHSTKEAKTRIRERIVEAWQEFGDCLELGVCHEDMVKHQLITGAQSISEQWLKRVEATLGTVPSGMPKSRLGNGRQMEYTADLVDVISVLTEVYVSDQLAVW